MESLAVPFLAKDMPRVRLEAAAVIAYEPKSQVEDAKGYVTNLAGVAVTPWRHSMFRGL
jgi:hypothetical protein